MRSLLLIAAFLTAPLASAQATFTVNSTADPGTGSCDATECTLREAILAAEFTSAPDSIHFDIPGAGPHTITVVGSSLPAMGTPVVIDGYTQPGSSPNTNEPTQGTNAVILIELVNGAGAAAVWGLLFCFKDKTVRGLAIGGFADNGIEIVCQGDVGHVVEGCFIGTDATGTIARPNGGSGVHISITNSNRIGGTTPAARNVLSGNGDFGVIISSAGSAQPALNNVIQGNLIGTDASGTVSLPNGISQTAGGVGIIPNQGSVAGNVVGGTTAAERNVISGNLGPGVSMGGADIRVEGNFIGTDVTGTLPIPNTGVGVSVSSFTTAIGGTAVGTGNRIAHNGSAGVVIPGLNTGVRVLGNAIFDNAGLGIDLAFLDGIPLPNDPGDADTGANRLQNFPEIVSASLLADQLTVSYFLDTDPANATYPFRIEFFRSEDGEGAALLGVDTYTEADHNGCGTPPCTRQVVFAPAAPIVDSDAAVATATDDAGNTSEFSDIVTVVASNDLVVALDPENPPIVIPPGGGPLQYDLTVSNLAPNPVTIDYWIVITGAEIHDPLRTPRTFTLLGEEAFMRSVMQRVPAAALPGLYTYTVNVGTFPGTVLASDSFTFEKSAAAQARNSMGRDQTGTAATAADWALGWEASDWIIIKDRADTGQETATAAAPRASAVVESLPTEFALHAAYPNPFNPQAIIPFDVAEAGQVRLTVYDLLGREVAVLVDETRQAGRHEAVLDGQGLASGVYLVRMTAKGGFTHARRVTLLR